MYGYSPQPDLTSWDVLPKPLPALTPCDGFTYSNLPLSKYSTAHAECPSGPFDTQAKMEGMLTLIQLSLHWHLPAVP